MKYLKIWTSFFDLIGQLQYDEIGRLFEAMLIYADSGNEPDNFDGNERFLWPVAKQQIDLAAEKNEKLRQNGMKGGRPKNEGNQKKPKITKQNQTEPNESYKEKEWNGIERKGMELFDDDDTRAREIQGEHDRILTAAEDAGFRMSNDVRAALIALYADHGLQKVLDGLKSCVDHGAPNLAYLKAVLKGEKKPVRSQGYEQRNNAGATEMAIEEMRRMIMESKNGQSGIGA